MPGGTVVKNPPAKQETLVWSLGWEDALEKEMATHSGIQPTPESHGQRRLAGYSPWGCKESDATERLGTTRVKKKKGWEAEDFQASESPLGDTLMGDVYCYRPLSKPTERTALSGNKRVRDNLVTP